MSYRTELTKNEIKISFENPQFKTGVEPIEYNVSLSRTGTQGTKGDSISNVYVDTNKNLVVEVSNSAGTVIETYSEALSELLRIIDLKDVSYETREDGDILIYDEEISAFTTHRFTTSNLRDVDDSARADGSILIFNGTAQKYKASLNIDNENFSIIGGTF